jgi:hypothetical protein
LGIRLGVGVVVIGGVVVGVVVVVSRVGVGIRRRAVVVVDGFFHRAQRASSDCLAQALVHAPLGEVLADLIERRDAVGDAAVIAAGAGRDQGVGGRRP